MPGRASPGCNGGMINYEAEATRLRKRVGATVFFLGVVMWLIGAAGTHFVTNYQGAEYNCLVAGPSSPLAYPLEASPVSAGFSWWPVGRECEWHTATGDTVVVRTDDWTATVVLHGIGAIALMGGLLAVWPARRRDTAEPETQP